MIRPYSENSGALFDQSLKSGNAEIMPAILDVFWCDICGQNGIHLNIFGQSQPTQGSFQREDGETRE